MKYRTTATLPSEVYKVSKMANLYVCIATSQVSYRRDGSDVFGTIANRVRFHLPEKDCQYYASITANIHKEASGLFLYHWRYYATAWAWKKYRIDAESGNLCQREVDLFCKMYPHLTRFQYRKLDIL